MNDQSSDCKPTPPTPLTDAALIHNAELSDEGHGYSNFVDADFSRDLERKLAAMAWISVGKEKPTHGRTVLCCVDNLWMGRYAMAGSYRGEFDSWLLDDGESEGEVTHWMTLPELPPIVT